MHLPRAWEPVLYSTTKKDTITQDLIQAIMEAPGDFSGALDAIAEEKTWRACAEVVKGLGGGCVVSNLPLGFTDVPEGVEVVAGAYPHPYYRFHTEIDYSHRHC